MKRIPADYSGCSIRRRRGLASGCRFIIVIVPYERCGVYDFYAVDYVDADSVDEVYEYAKRICNKFLSSGNVVSCDVFIYELVKKEHISDGR